YPFFFQAEDGIRDFHVTGVQTCALPIFSILLGEEEGADKTFEQLAQKPNDVVREKENMELVMTKMNKDDVWIMPVLDDNDRYLEIGRASCRERAEVLGVAGSSMQE